MSIRDEEIKKLENYAKGLGLKVEYKQHHKGDPGAALISSNGVSERIEMYLWPRKSKTQIVLDFLHELAHHMGFVYRGRVDDPALLEALIEESERQPNDPRIPIAKRKLIYDCEKSDSQYRLMIAREVGIKISEEKIKYDIELDIWVYRHYWKHGDLPTRYQTRTKKRQLKEKYASKNQEN